MKPHIFFCSILLLCLFTFSLNGATSQNIDFAKLIKEQLKTNEKKTAFDNVIKQHSSVIKNIAGNKITFTFTFYNEKGELGEKIDFVSNINQNEKNKSMTNIKNTKIYYKTVKIDKNIDYIYYGFTRPNGAFCRDDNAEYVWSDKRKSSYIRVSDKVGAWGQIKDYFNKDKYTLLKNRFVYAYLPVAYFNNPEQEFKVIYMLDGQNIWDNPECAYKGWKVDSIMEKLASENKIEPAIIVGINNTAKRTQEYAGWSNVLKEEKECADGTPPEYKVYAQEHAKMIVEDIIPFVESHLRVKTGRENRIIAGSSYGAFCSAYLLANFADTFIGAGLFSGGGSGYEQLVLEKAFNDKSQKIYIDIGNGDFIEKQLLPGSELLNAYLLKNGFVQNENLYYQLCDKASHNEKEWAKRVPDFLKFMLSKGDKFLQEQNAKSSDNK